MHVHEGLPFVLLNDQPLGNPDDDLLGTRDVADGIAGMLLASRTSSPFVLAIDAGWGMGKSTLLHQIEARLRNEPGIATVSYNAWTASGDQALEGLIKSVLVELDPNIVRRGLRRLHQHDGIRKVVGVATSAVIALTGTNRLVDRLWTRLAVDARGRNELRTVIQKMLADYVKVGTLKDPCRAVIVLLDDLDRCDDKVIVAVCEAIKLYLDAPGLIFVVSCDQSILARGVAGSARGGATEGHAYLEKIVQVAYRLPPATDLQIRALIAGYAAESGIATVIEDVAADILATRTGRNPRRIKRILNSVVLESQLEPAWRQQPLGSAHLVTAILLQHLYPGFYDLLVRDTSATNPIMEFLAYVAVRPTGFAQKDQEDPWWNTAAAVFEAYNLAAPNTGSYTSVHDAMERLEAALPEDFPSLARNPAFVDLLRGIAQPDALRDHLMRRPLVADPYDSAVATSMPARPLAGMSVVWVDDNPDSVRFLSDSLEELGADVRVYADEPSATRAILNRPPDVVLSDITRGEDPDAGFTHIEALRRGGYQGPVVFFTGRVTPDRRKRAIEVRANAITSNPGTVTAALIEIAAGVVPLLV